MLFVIIFVVTSIIVFLVGFIGWKLVWHQKNIYDYFRDQGVEGEPFRPIFGQMREINLAQREDRIMDYYAELSEKHRHVFLFNFGPLTRLHVIEPDLLADILNRTYSQNYLKTSLQKTVFKPLIGLNNLLVSEGVEHERARKMLNAAFHFSNLQSMVSTMADVTNKSIDGILLSAMNGPIDLQTEFSALTLIIIASCAFGKEFVTMDNGKDIVHRAFTVVLEAIDYRTRYMVNQIPFLAQLPFWRKHIVDKGSREMMQLVEQIITDRRQGLSTSLCAGNDILDILLSSVDSNGQPFSDDEIKQQALTFVFAGHETTAHLLTWVMYVLMTNENILRACQNEIDNVLKDEVNITYEKLHDLVVCDAVLHETLRLYPPAPFFARFCINEHIIGKETDRPLRIPAHATIVVNSYALHRRADFWPRPLEFDHTRWLRDPVTGYKPKLAHPFCFLPFAAGPRNCIGQNFALIEAKVILSMLLKRCQFNMEPGQIVTPDLRITMRPKYGLRARVTQR